MASPSPNPVAAEAEGGPLKFTLQILSPSTGVPQPLVIQGLPASATIKQLKERLRNILLARPSDQAQRLIHRGRLLAREEETMLNVFGEEALRSTDHQTLHLVLRDLSDARPAFAPGPPQQSVNQSTGTTQQPAGAGAQPQPHYHHHPLPQAAAALPAHTQVRIGAGQWPLAGNVPFGQQFQFPTVGITAGVQPLALPLNLPPGTTPQQFAAQYQREVLAARYPQLGQRRLDELLDQNLRELEHRAARALQTPSLQGTGTQHEANATGRTASPLQPDATRTVVREGVGPNGQQWRITVNESISNALHRQGRTGSPLAMADTQGPWRPPSGIPQPRPPHNGGQLSGSEVQTALRAADALQATRSMTDAMRRNASATSLSNLASAQSNRPLPPGVTTPSLMAHPGRSAAGTPDSFREAGIGRNAHATQSQAQATSGTPEVYILSSPSGPRALLLNGNLDVYFTPHARASNQFLGLRNLLGPGLWGVNGLPNIHPPTSTQINPSHRSPAGAGTTGMNGSQAQQPPQEQAQNGLPQPQGQAQPGHAVARPDNAQVEAVRIANLWPAVWGMIRLSLFLFVWWYTSPTATWSRLMMVVFIAVTFFLANTGLLTPLTGQIWVPIRQHLENLIPLADHHRDAQPARAADAQGGNGNEANAEAQRGLDPADTAARLVQQRRERNANWLANQVRRLERAGVLFLASIAPGVAERHIAHLEAEARAERQRRETEEAAAREAASAAQEGNGDAPESAGQAQESSGSSTAIDQQNQAEEAEGEGLRARAPNADRLPVAA
ncbi:hypothetical protein DL764_007135 [Monosporascus ibericus]|uniref:Ubiquitin-like domain-containing protein n=1 Tax=Monosporascus ibericus TaxID=155417 RepID=A0A4V1X9V8_9PEZI|nr:hypothetical protein DL764_007135 [Monosporascus ibericus]